LQNISLGISKKVEKRCNIYPIWEYIYIEEHKTTDAMKRFSFEFKEISYGVIEIYAENEEEAREFADCAGMRFVKDSTLELGAVREQQDI
jgi:hypothetical protein